MFDDSSAWATPQEPSSSGDLVKDAIRKDRVVKSVIICDVLIPDAKIRFEQRDPDCTRRPAWY